MSKLFDIFFTYLLSQLTKLPELSVIFLTSFSKFLFITSHVNIIFISIVMKLHIFNFSSDLNFLTCAIIG